METKIKGSPSFSHIHMNLEPGESIIAESGAMASMDVGIDLRSKINGGFLKGLLIKLFGKESFFLSKFTNKSDRRASVVFTQSTPGDIYEHRLESKKDELYIQPGAFLCRTKGRSSARTFDRFIESRRSSCDGCGSNLNACRSTNSTLSAEATCDPTAPPASPD